MYDILFKDYIDKYKKLIVRNGLFFMIKMKYKI